MLHLQYFYTIAWRKEMLTDDWCFVKASKPSSAKNIHYKYIIVLANSANFKHFLNITIEALTFHNFSARKEFRKVKMSVQIAAICTRMSAYTKGQSCSTKSWIGISNLVQVFLLLCWTLEKCLFSSFGGGKGVAIVSAHLPVKVTAFYWFNKTVEYHMWNINTHSSFPFCQLHHFGFAFCGLKLALFLFKKMIRYVQQKLNI